MIFSSCPRDYVYNQDTQLCNKFETIPPTNCDDINKKYYLNKINIVYNSQTKKCEYISENYDNDLFFENGEKIFVKNKLSILEDPNCPPNYTITPDKQCIRVITTSPINYTVTYIILFIMFVIALVYFYTRKKNSNSFNR
jgi:hypothetical protein